MLKGISLDASCSWWALCAFRDPSFPNKKVTKHTTNHKGHEGYYRRIAGRKTLEEIDAGIPAKPASDIVAKGNDMVSRWRNGKPIIRQSCFLIRYIY